MSKVSLQAFPTSNPAANVWRAINVPLTGELLAAVNPYLFLEYEGLTPDKEVQRGTVATYRPDYERLASRIGAVSNMLPKDVTLRTTQHDRASRTRVDVVESEKHEGEIRYRVEEASATSSILVVEGDIILGGSYRMFEGMVAPFAEQGIREHYGRVLEHLSEIIRR